MNSKKIVALLLCLGLSFQSTALSGVLYDENAVVKASAEESGKTHSGRASVGQPGLWPENARLARNPRGTGEHGAGGAEFASGMMSINESL